MGNTVWSQRIVLEQLVHDLQSYGKALRQEERETYERLLKKSMKHVGSITYASSIHVWAFLLLSVMLEQEKRIKLLEDESLADRRLQEQEQDCSVDKNT